MELPALDGIIDRRILINYRIKPEIVKSILPPHLEPLLISGFASGGICLLRLRNIGVKHSPLFLRINSENAAHRFLITYRKGGQIIKGVYIPRRDTDSKLNVLLAGKFFSWPHFPAVFQVKEGDDRYLIKMKSRDGKTELEADAELDDSFPNKSMFDSLEHASSCFESCPIGVSPSTDNKTFKTIRLETKTWNVKALLVRSLRSSFFDDKSIFPQGTIEFDNAMLMEGIEHQWVSEED